MEHKLQLLLLHTALMFSVPQGRVTEPAAPGCSKVCRKCGAGWGTAAGDCFLR